MRKRLKKRNLIVGGVLMVLATGSLIIGIATHNADQKPAQTIIQDTGYTTLLPSNKTIIQLGGWKRVSPEKSDPVYAYSDTLNSVSISVSEQLLPSSFKTDVSNSVAELAKSYNATATTSVGDMVVYVGSSAKGPQSVIFTKKGLLVLIKSEKKIENTAWSDYAVSLH